MRKFFVVSIVLVMVGLLTGCSRSMSTAPIATPLPLSEQRVAEIAAEVAAKAVEGIEIPQPISQQEVAAIAQLVVDEAVDGIEFPEQPTMPQASVTIEDGDLPDCPLDNQGLRIEFSANLDQEEGFYNLSSEIEQLQPYLGCNVLIEGRQFLTEEHHIWFFRGPWQLSIREGSLWAYPADWNMADFSTEKPPIAAEFVTSKRHNMLENGYDWLIFVHAGENVFEFPAGQDTPVVQLPDNAEFLEPEPLVVQGVWDGEMFDASIGAEDTVTVAMLDGELFYWVNAQDNILYQSVEAWTMPSAWSLEQIESWAGEKFPSHDLLEYNG